MKKSAETKKLLLDTVKDLLSRTADIKVKDITDTAFVNIAAVNYHFDDKDKLVELAMNEIFVDFKYVLNSFEREKFDTADNAITGFITMIFDFTKSHLGFFMRIAQSGMQGTEYFHEDEFTRIASRQLHSLGIEKSGDEVSAIFASVLAQIVFAVLYFPKELEKGKEVGFMKTYFTQIQNTFN